MFSARSKAALTMNELKDLLSFSAAFNIILLSVWLKLIEVFAFTIKKGKYPLIYKSYQKTNQTFIYMGITTFTHVRRSDSK